MQLQAVVTATASPAPLQESKELFAAGIPGAGIAVPGIFKLGVSVSYEVGTSATFAGSATVDFGLEASLPNNAKVIADITNPSSSSATGWQGTSFKPNLEVTKLSASLTLAAFSKPKLSFGIELVKVGQVDVGLTMKLPEISSALSAEYGTFFTSTPCCVCLHVKRNCSPHLRRCERSLLPVFWRLENGC